MVSNVLILVTLVMQLGQQPGQGRRGQQMHLSRHQHELLNALCWSRLLRAWGLRFALRKHVFRVIEFEKILRKIIT